jgi:hypothetical protein
MLFIGRVAKAETKRQATWRHKGLKKRIEREPEKETARMNRTWKTRKCG